MFDFIKYLKNNRLTQTDKLSERAKKFINEDYNPEIPDGDQKIGSSDKTSNRVGGVQSKLAVLKKKKDELVQKFTSGMIDIHQYKQMIGNIPQQIKNLQADLDRDTMEIGDDEDGMNEATGADVDSVVNAHTPELVNALNSRRRNREDVDAYRNVESLLKKMATKLGCRTDVPFMEDEMFSGKYPAKEVVNYIKEMFTSELNDMKISNNEDGMNEMSHEKKNLGEIEVTEESDLGQSVMNLAKMNDQIEKLSVELKKLEREHSELQKPIYSILEDLNTLHDDVDKSIKVGNHIIVTFKTKPTEVTNYKYKEAFQLLESKVNGAIRALVNEVKEANKSVSSRKGTISVTKLNEAGIDVAAFDSLANSFSDKVDSIHNIISKLTGNVA